MNTEEFKSALERQVQTFFLERGRALQLAPNVFSVQLFQPEEFRHWANICFYDDREVKVRDEASSVHCRVAEIMTAMGFTGNKMLLQDPDDHIRVAFLALECTGVKPENILAFATQILVGVDGEELSWFDAAETVSV